MLVIAVVFIAVFCTSSYGVGYSGIDPETVTPTPMLVSQSPIYLIANLVIAVILFVTIFLYNKLKLQMKLTATAAVLICVSAIGCGWMVYGSDANVEWTGGIFLLAGAFISTLMAYNFMRRDYKLLTSYERLR